MGRLCWSLSLPAIAGVLLLGAAPFADAMFVGRVAGTTELGAILVSFPITMIASAIAALFGSGAAALSSRAIGDNDDEGVVRVGSAFLGWSLLASVVSTVVVVAATPQLLVALGARGAMLASAIDYTRIVFLGTPFGVFVFGASFLIRSEGRIAASMVLLGGSSIFNVLADAWLVGILELGATGAAWATFATMVTTAVATAGYLARSDSLLHPLRWRPALSRMLLGPMLRDGSAPMLLYVVALVQQGIVFRVAASWGTEDDVVFAGAFLRVAMLAAVPLWGIAMALQPVIGMNHGADKPRRVRRALHVFAGFASLFAIAAWALATLLPHHSLAMFIDDPALISSHIGSFRLLMLTFPTQGVQLVTVALLIGVGRGVQAALILLLRNVLILAPLALVLPLAAGIDGLWWALVATDGLCFVIAVALCVSITAVQPTAR